MMLEAWEKNPVDGKEALYEDCCPRFCVFMKRVTLGYGNIVLLPISIFILSKFEIKCSVLTERGRRNKRKRGKHHNVFLTLLIDSY